MNDFTPEQQNQIKTWASERDSLTSEIASKRAENESLKKSNSNLCISNTELSERILVSEGRLKELASREKEIMTLTSLEVADLEKVKTRLETEVFSLKKDIENLNNEGVFERAQTLDGIFSHATQVNDENVAKMNNLMIEMTNSVQKLYDTNEANIEKANYYINELSKIFFIAQKTSPIKKIM